MALKPTVLLYNFTDQKRRNKINTFCAMHGIRVKLVDKTSYGRPILSLLENVAEEISVDEISDFSDEMLVMCGLGSQMNAFLAYLRKEKVIVPLTAMLTPTHQLWNSAQLYAEIRQEHEQMARLNSGTDERN